MEKQSVNACTGEIVLEMEKMLATTDPLVEWPRWNKPSIYRVPRWLRKDAEEAYRPRLVSLGPFHHDHPDLLPMEEHKHRAMLHIAKRSRKPLGEFFAAVEEVADELMDAYHDLNEKWRGAARGRFVQMMVVDGCFLLEIIKALQHRKAPDDYSPSDPVFSARGVVSLWVGIRYDILIIENQVPMLALYTLEAVWSGRRDDELVQDINKQLLELFGMEGELMVGIDAPSLHPLDIFHKSFCGIPPPRQEFSWPESSILASVEELRDAGIHFKRSKTHRVGDISFKNGVLSLPALSIHDETKKIFLNLMAFERLHVDTGTMATDYLIFMDDIIHSERDIALLKSKGIISNLLSSDKDAAKFYKNILVSRGAQLSPFSRLHDVRRQVNYYRGNPWNKLKPSIRHAYQFFRHAYLRNPCVFISFVAAIILLVATLLQTVYTVWGFYSPNNKSYQKTLNLLLIPPDHRIRY